MKKLKEDFETSGGAFKEWRIGDLFLLKSNPQLDKDNFVFSENAKYPYFTRTVFNNGIFGNVEFFDNDHLIKGNSIAVGMMGMQFFYMRDDFYAGQFTKTAYPKFGEFNESIALYFISLLNRFQRKYLGVLVRNFEETFYNTEVELPTFNNEPSYSYMEQYITLLEEEKMLQVDKFLNASGLNDTTLTAEETSALEKFRNGEVKFEERKIGELFEKVKLGISNPNFNKKTDLSACKDLEHPIPVINAKIGDNGIMYWAKQGDFETISKCIDVIQNGAIATGKVYAQPQETGVLWDSYLIKHVKTTLEDEQLFFFATVIEKSIRLKFYYDCKAYWNEVKEEFIMLPCTLDNDIDYTFMQHFISALEKLVIRGVVKYKDEMLNANLKTYSFGTDCYNVAAEPNLQNK